MSEERIRKLEAELAELKVKRADVPDNGESEHPCFRPGFNADDDEGFGTCQSDGWFRCPECIDLDPSVRDDWDQR